MKTYTVYFIEHLKTGEIIYLGTTKKRLHRRFAIHCCPSHSDRPVGKLIQKHGKNAFVVKPLQSYNSKEDAISLEAQTIKMWQPLCNVCPNGTGYSCDNGIQTRFKKGVKPHNKSHIWDNIDRVIQLRYVEKWTHQQIANMFGCDRKTVSNVLKHYENSDPNSQDKLQLQPQ